MRQTLLSYLTDYNSRGKEVAFAHRQALRIRSWSYQRISASASAAARTLDARGIGKGDRVLIWAPNSPEWVAAFWGCLLRGVIVVPLDIESAPDFVARVQQQVEAKLLLHDGGHLQKLPQGLPSVSLSELTQTSPSKGFEDYPTAQVGPDDIVEIIYTSGTTAEPKGVVLTHRNLLANIAPLENEIQKYLKWERLVHPLHFLNLVPLSHVFGQFLGIFVPNLLGGEVFFHSSLKPSEIIETVRQQRISIVVAVPRMLDTLRDAIEREQTARGGREKFARALEAAARWNPLRRWWAFRDVHRRFGWKFWAFVVGGATLAPETESFWRHLGFAVVQGYGMTETAAIITVDHPFKHRRGSIGQSLPDQELRLGPDGEIMVRGANVSPGYWRGGDVQPMNGDTGWLSTGDIGALDEGGHLHFKGRKKEVIVTSAGLNIYPDDLEAALNRQAEVRESVVTSVDGAFGPEPAAVLLLRDRKADPAQIIGRANKELAAHQQIRRWFVWPEADFPRTATQKVRRGAVAEIMKADQSGESSGPAPGNTLAAIIASVAGNESLAKFGPAANLSTDLKLDSLGRVELLSAIEQRYQVELDETAFTAAITIGEIEQMLNTGIPAEQLAPYPYPEWSKHFPITWVRFVLFYVLVLPLTRVLCPMYVRGREHLRDVARPALFVANHLSMVDHALILTVLPFRLRQKLAIAMDGEILREWRYPPAGTGPITRLRWLAQYLMVLSMFNVFPLPRKSGFRQSFIYAGEAVDRGNSLMVFPEGHRSEDGTLQRFMVGIGLLVKGLQIPVVPIRIEGLFELKRLGRHRARRGEVTLIIGAPECFSAGAEAAQIARDLEQRVANL
jgi:long-chain acyl-CoA synthetase